MMAMFKPAVPPLESPLRELVLLGGGHSHVEVLRRFAMKPPANARVTLIARESHAPYSGMLPGYIAGHYTFDETHIDLRPLARAAGCRLLRDEVVEIDLPNRRVRCRDRPPIPFDLLSINTGSTPAMAQVEGAAEFAIPAKPVDGFIRGWHGLLERAGSTEAPFRIAVVGTGAGGVELTLTMQHAIETLRKVRGQRARHVEFHLIGEDAQILSSHQPGVRRRMMRILAKRGIHLHLHTPVARVDPDALETETGERFPADAVIWVTHASPPPWAAASGLATDDAGFIAVDRTLRSVSHSEVFAVGDVATMVADPRPKSGVFAVRQGPHLAENLRRTLDDRPRLAYKPQRAHLALIGTGNRSAIASRGSWSAQGRLMWWWKDRIDRKWMAMYRGMPAAMPMDEAAMRCGGCGSKIGPELLGRILRELDPGPHEGVIVGLDSPDDAAVVEVPAGHHAVHTVDFFRSFLDDPHLFGQAAANHALGDIHAMGARPHNALALLTLPPGTIETMEATARDVLAGAMKILRRDGVALVGGHTAEGPELMFGLSVNGYAEPHALLGKGGLRAGDALILAKPIGVGALLAADLRGRARGQWIEGALDSMLRSNADALRCFQGHNATACTDVTGFGLAGHLLEMLDASGTGAEIDLHAVPLLDGASEISTMGIASTLYPENLRTAAHIRDNAAFEDRGAYRLLFDPQTCGGLLAGIPADRAEDCVAALRAAGYRQAAVFGRCITKIEGAEAIQLSG